MTNFKLNWKPSPTDERDFLYEMPRKLQAYPLKADILRLLPNVFTQRLGDCSANSGVTAFMAIDKKEGSPPVNLSRLFLYWNTRSLEGTTNEDSGAYIRDVFKAAEKFGICPESAWGYNNHLTTKPKLTAYRKAVEKPTKYMAVPMTIEAVKDCIVNEQPVIFGFDVYDSFMKIGKDGKMPMPIKSREKIQGGHSCTIYGYDDTKKVLLIRNSWGTEWGDKGNFYMPYKVFTNGMSSDAWTLVSTIK